MTNPISLQQPQKLQGAIGQDSRTEKPSDAGFYEWIAGTTDSPTDGAVFVWLLDDLKEEKDPKEVQAVLSQWKEDCSPEEYQARFQMLKRLMPAGHPVHTLEG